MIHEAARSGDVEWPMLLRPKRELYVELLDLSDAVIALARHQGKSVGEAWDHLLLLHAMLVKTGRSILLLADAGHLEDALALHRNLLEATFNLVYMLHVGPEVVLPRFKDWLVLDVISRYKPLNYYRGTPEHSQAMEDFLIGREKEVERRYTPTELKTLRKHGAYPGSLRDRAAAVGWADKYDSTYRTLSRNVHLMDVVDLAPTTLGRSLKLYERMLYVRLDLLATEGIQLIGPATCIAARNLGCDHEGKVAEWYARAVGEPLSGGAS